MDLAALGGFIALVVSPFIGWLVASRRYSGRIQTTEASQLWAAAEQLRDDLTEQIKDLRKRVQELETELYRERRETGDLRMENNQLRGENERLRAQT